MTQHQREGQVNPAIDGECPSQLKRGLGARHIQMIALGGASAPACSWGREEILRWRGPRSS